MASATSSSFAERWRRGARRSSLRLRIAALAAALVLVAILVQAFTIFAVFEEKEDALIDAIAVNQLAHSMAQWRESPERASPNTPNMRLYRRPHGDADAALPAALRALPVGNHEVSDGEREYHVAVRDDADARYLLTYDAEEHEEAMAAIGSAIVLSALVIAGAVLVLVYLFAGRLTRQLDQLAQRVDQGGAGRHLQPAMTPEVGAVAAALDRYEQRQQRAVAREREFTANLSHELRTPLAVIRTDAELLVDPARAAGDAAAAALQRRARRIVDTVDRITELSSSLLTLAREARPQLEEAVRLHALLQECWAALAARHGDGDGVALRLALPEAATVTGDPALLRLVVSNLLDNARRHADGQPVDCRLAGSVLEVRDRGPGFAADDLAHLFERGWRASRDGIGHGLGLALVQHACSASGWAPGAANADGGGALLRVDFGAALRAD